jgi:hypothetical protein
MNERDTSRAAQQENQHMHRVRSFFITLMPSVHLTRLCNLQSILSLKHRARSPALLQKSETSGSDSIKSNVAQRGMESGLSLSHLCLRYMYSIHFIFDRFCQSTLKRSRLNFVENPFGSNKKNKWKKQRKKQMGSDTEVSPRIALVNHKVGE